MGADSAKRNESYEKQLQGPVPTISDDEAKQAALVLVGIGIGLDVPPCGLRDVLDALSLRAILLGEDPQNFPGESS